MGRLKLRNFATMFILVSCTMGMALNFSSDLVENSGRTFSEESEINQLRSDFAERGQNYSEQTRSAQDVGIQTDFFFLAEVWNIIKTVAGGAGDVLALVKSAEQIIGLNIPGSVLNLSYIVIIGVIFAVVSAARGWDV